MHHGVAEHRQEGAATVAMRVLVSGADRHGAGVTCHIQPDLVRAPFSPEAIRVPVMLEPAWR